MTPAEFDTQLAALKPGDTVTYHTGLLMYSRQRESHAPNWRQVADLQAHVFHLSGEPNVEEAQARVWPKKPRVVALTQRRTAHGCEYLATKL